MRFLLFSILLILFMPTTVQAGSGGANRLFMNESNREYFISVESALLNDVSYKSITTSSLATSDYTSTDTWPVNIKLIDSNSAIMRCLTTSVTGFSVATAGTTNTAVVTMSSTTIDFVGGAAKATVLSTGPWVVGSYFTLTLPAIVFGGITASSSTAITSFTTN